MTTNNYHCEYASEEISEYGSTGRFREVIEAVAMDFGGNILAGPGRVERIAARKFRVPVRIVPTIMGVVAVSANNLVHGHTGVQS